MPGLVAILAVLAAIVAALAIAVPLGARIPTKAIAVIAALLFLAAAATLVRTVYRDIHEPAGAHGRP